MGESGSERSRGCLRPTCNQPHAVLGQTEEEGESWGTGVHKGKVYERWQYEATSGGRIFYFVDDPTDGGRRRAERPVRVPRPRRRVIIEAVHPGHPKGTERKGR